MRIPASASIPAALLLACALTACVTVAEPVPVGDGDYSIDTGGGAGDEHYQQAIRFCFDQGKQLVRVDGQGAAIGQGSRAGGELRFRCVGPGEPGWKEPVG